MDLVQIGEFLVWGPLAQTSASLIHPELSCGQPGRSEAGEPGVESGGSEDAPHSASPPENAKRVIFLLCHLISGFTDINII